MQFVSRNIKDDAYYGTIHPLPLKNRYHPNTVYYYDRLERVKYHSTLYNFIDDHHKNHLNQDPTSFILVNYQDDYFNIFDVNHWINSIKRNKVSASKYVFVVKDAAFRNFVARKFRDHGIHGASVTILDQLKLNVHLQNLDVSKPKHKFSALSRCYQPWRAYLFGELNKEDLLKDFTFSFWKTNPYFAPPKELTADEVVYDVAKFTSEFPDEETVNFFENAPYKLSESSETPKYSSLTYEAILDSDFHLMIESHFIQDSRDYQFRGEFLGEWINMDLPEIDQIPMRDIAPTFFTEKTYKAIVCKKPFIAASTPYFMEDFNKLGYKSFSPWIDESYDQEEDHVERIKKIVKEFKRLQNLPEDEYQTIVEKCSEICDHNLKVLIEQNFGISQKYYQEYPEIMPHLRLVADGYWQKDGNFDIKNHHFSKDQNFW